MFCRQFINYNLVSFFKEKVDNNRKLHIPSVVPRGQKLRRDSMRPRGGVPSAQDIPVSESLLCQHVWGVVAGNDAEIHPHRRCRSINHYRL